MYRINSRGDLPGPGDSMPPDTSLYDEAVERMTEEILDEWIADASFYQDYGAGFTTETWEAFERAIASCSDVEACAIYRNALREEMREDAENAARQRIKDDREQAQMDAAEARAAWL